MIKNKFKIKINKKKVLMDTLPSLIAVLIALTVGAFIMQSKGVNPFSAYFSMFKVAFYQTSSKYPFNGLAQTLVYATPLLFASLSVMIAYKAGMFNIGVQGQMMAGGLGATIVGAYFKSVFGHYIFAIIAAMIFGFLWAGIAGILKSKFGIHEVISTIMLNHIIKNIQDYLLRGPLRDPSSSNPQSVRIGEFGKLPTLFQEITKQSLNIGFILAILTVILIYYFFKNAKLGYEIKAVGFNPTVAENAGINPKFIAFVSMGIAGAVAGLGGAERILGGSTQYAYTELIMGDFGFSGLAVALLGKNNPFGILIATIFYSALEIGGQVLQQKFRMDKEIVYIVQALIIIFVAAENLFKMILNKKRKG